MSNKNYYGEQFEGMIIIGMSIIIVASMFGAAVLMANGMKECRSSDYTYCGEKAVEHH